jgi:hypothetical protein
MKRFFHRTLLSILVIITFIVIINLIIDPFKVNNFVGLDLPREQVSSQMHNRLFKMSQYISDPKDIIILGDSRAKAIKEEYFNELGHKGISNLAFGGGTLYEAIDAFWYVEKDILKLKKVYIGIPFNLYNELNRMNLVPEANAFLEHPVSYHLNSFILKASLFNIYAKLTGNNPASRKPDMKKEKFWQYQLLRTNKTYSTWKTPKLLYERLVELADYCKANNIELIFFIPPTHLDLQNKVVEHGLQDKYAAYKKQLAELSTLIDFDFPNDITRDKSRFKDPYHASEEVARQVAGELLDPKGIISIISSTPDS